MTRSVARRTGALALLAVPLFLTSCKEGLTELDDFAFLRFVAAAPDGPSADVYVEGITIPLAAALAYGRASSTVALPGIKGAILEYRAVGADPRSEPAFVGDTFVVQPGSGYTFVLAGLVESDAESDRFRELSFRDGFALIEGTTARVRIVHASPDAGALGFDIVGSDEAEVVLNRFEASGAEGLVVPAGETVSLAVQVGGAPARTFDLPELTAGGEYYAVLTGLLELGPASPDGSALVLVDANDEAAVLRPTVP